MNMDLARQQITWQFAHILITVALWEDAKNESVARRGEQQRHLANGRLE